jgi:hypothetical protein
MGWASHLIEQLRRPLPDTEVTFRPRGNSMSGIIESGQEVTVKPVEKGDLQKGDVVLCTVKGKDYLHKIVAIKGLRYQIGNNKGKINGWIGFNQIHGKVTDIKK